MLHPLGLICFLLIISGALANDVFRSKRIKIDQVLGGVVLYLNIGLTFAVAYTLVEHLSPGAFLLPQPAPGFPVHPTYFAYFSFVTLTTVGYGDTVPVEAIARSLATLEAALGQLYPAIILARLVSIEVSQRDQRANHKTGRRWRRMRAELPATSETKAAKSQRASRPARSERARALCAKTRGHYPLRRQYYCTGPGRDPGRWHARRLIWRLRQPAPGRNPWEG